MTAGRAWCLGLLVSLLLWALIIAAGQALVEQAFDWAGWL